MAENSKISWCHHTFNAWVGCAKVSAGCARCYAEELMDKRYGKVQWGPQGTRVKTSPANWKLPIRWNKQAQKEDTRYRVFCASLADVFEDRPELVPWRVELMALIQKTPYLDWLLLSKRPENAPDMMKEVVRLGNYTANDWLAMGLMPPNVWLGTSVENQEQADKRIPELIKMPAMLHFLSMEPLLGTVNLGLLGAIAHSSPYSLYADHIKWVIVGGESGAHARPMNLDWARDVRDQCQYANVKFFFKQTGTVAAGRGKGESEDDIPADLYIRDIP